ncbi:hypothetical protein ILUMI_21751 [Ignelater luminosus]|uniref:Reverse transcriptase domain-containing protein n=1 Tax=Ignelater luminosus TaxID=2038154 RepID=A0A8K0G151_IGNLU|nr:hypothetical protein ILUMI_21751 [Ignelater luminosus]
MKKEHILIKFRPEATIENFIDNTNSPEPLRLNDEGTDIKLTFNAVNCDIVNKLIGDITSNATGYGKINIKMIKLCCPYILRYITHILNHCIAHSTYPSQWKHAIIKPIPKVKNPIEFKDLRPISLLPVLSKLFEKIIFTQLLSYLNEHNILPEVRSGFRNNEKIPILNQAKSLGIIMDNSFRFKDQISNYISRAYQNLRKIFPHRSSLNIETKKRLCEAFVLSQFNYCVPVYHAALDNVTSGRIKKVQNSCLRYVYEIRKYDHISHKFVDSGWLSMENRRILQTSCLHQNIIKYKHLPYLYNKITFRTDCAALHAPPVCVQRYST